MAFGRGSVCWYPCVKPFWTTHAPLGHFWWAPGFALDEQPWAKQISCLHASDTPGTLASSLLPTGCWTSACPLPEFLPHSDPGTWHTVHSPWHETVTVAVVPWGHIVRPQTNQRVPGAPQELVPSALQKTNYQRVTIVIRLMNYVEYGLPLIANHPAIILVSLHKIGTRVLRK